jgi:hypothetical protein
LEVLPKTQIKELTSKRVRKTQAFTTAKVLARLNSLWHLRNKGCHPNANTFLSLL